MIETGALVKFKSTEELNRIRYSGLFSDLAALYADRIALVIEVWKRGPEGLDRKYAFYFPDKDQTHCWFDEDEFTVLEEDIFAKYRKEIIRSEGDSTV